MALIKVNFCDAATKIPIFLNINCIYCINVMLKLNTHSVVLGSIRKKYFVPQFLNTDQTLFK